MMQVRPAVAVAVGDRPVQAFDEAFLRRIFIADRLPEFLAAGLPPAQAEVVLADQFRLQCIGYGSDFPRAEHRILLWKGQPVGRLILADEGDHLVVVDLLIDGPYRGRGIGTEVMQRIQDRAGATGFPVRLQAIAGTPGERLYQHLGFRATGATPERVHMEWAP
jgi:GNAT superfamily N-acetyltransferase